MGDEQGGTPWLGEAAVPGAQPCPRPSVLCSTWQVAAPKFSCLAGRSEV